MTRVLLLQCTDTSVAEFFSEKEQTIKPASEIHLAFGKSFAPRDTGIDLPMPITHVCTPGSVTKMPLGVAVAAFDVQSGPDGETWVPIPTFLIARSSISKTPLRQCNPPGLIDSGYRGQLIAAVDNISVTPYRALEGNRYFQLLACDGVPFDRLTIVDVLPTTERGSGGFGSTGK